ncbi:MAG TPA: GntR family transcriptional regulator [Pirellulales bacterium]|nr:GntR family transcriptional regulator [Pirellulales bacterium]
MSSPTEAGRHCMSDRIRRTLTARILDGTLQPGQRLIELAIAREFDTSQTPVREAFRELETLRLVESAPYRGTRVRAVSDRDTAEAYAVRAVLEQMAAELAAPLLKGNTAGLQQPTDACIRAAKTGDREAYIEHNYKFHHRIMAASGNHLLQHIWESLGFDTRSRVTMAHHSLDLNECAAEHQAIVDALQSGDGATAGRLLRKHAEALIPHDEQVPAK